MFVSHVMLDGHRRLNPAVLTSVSFTGLVKRDHEKNDKELDEWRRNTRMSRWKIGSMVSIWVISPTSK